MSIHIKQMNLLQNIPPPVPTFTISTDPPLIMLNKGEGELFAGIENTVGTVFKIHRIEDVGENV